MRHITAAVLALPLTCWLISASAGGSRLASILDESGDIGLLHPISEVPHEALTIAGFEVVGQELTAIQDRFGSSPIFRLGSMEGAPKALCYTSKNLAVLIRAGSMGGWTRATGVSIMRIGALRSLHLTCPAATALVVWADRDGRDRLDARWWKRTLNVSSLPARGVIAVDRMPNVDQDATRTTVVEYEFGKKFGWVDIGQFTER